MREDNAEITFEHCGYECEVRIIHDSHRSGYVAVKEGHPLYGVYYDDVPNDFNPDVNGGLTYSREEGDDWAFGFDFAHCWNIPDLNICSYKTTDDTERLAKMYPNEARPDTLEEVIKDCKILAEALKAYEGKEYVYGLDDWNYYSDKLPDSIVCNGTLYIKQQDYKESATLIEMRDCMIGSDVQAYQCSKCGYDENTFSAKYCGGCGARFEKER